MRTFPGYDELYWNVTGTQFPRVVTASVTVDVPGGCKRCSVWRAGRRTIRA